MPSLRRDLVFHTRFRRPAHGSLPLFALGGLAFVLAALWFVPVRSPEALPPTRIGVLSTRSDELSSLIVLQKSPLPFTQGWGRDAELESEYALPLRLTPELREAPPLPLLPAYNSAVLREDDLLALPPAEKEVQP